MCSEYIFMLNVDERMPCVRKVMFSTFFPPSLYLWYILNFTVKLVLPIITARNALNLFLLRILASSGAYEVFATIPLIHVATTVFKNTTLPCFCELAKKTPPRLHERND